MSESQIPKKDKNPDDARLCYVKYPWCYFTYDFDNETGDDWDDRPYEYNAGQPYLRNGGFRVAYEGSFAEPNESHTNSPFSVDDINRGAVAWLRGEYGCKVNIQAGTTFGVFKKLMASADAEIYVRL